MLTNKGQKGVTLVELLITLVVTAILTAIAVPSLRSYIQETRIATLSNDFVAIVHDTRSEAATRGAPVVICATQDGFRCSGSWDDGWMSYLDLNNNGTRDIGNMKPRDLCDPVTQECVVRRVYAPAGGALLANVASHASLGFMPTGFLTGGAETFELCVAGVATGRQITILASGQVNITGLEC